MIRRNQLHLIALATVLVSTASVAHAQNVVSGYGNRGRTTRTYSYQGRYQQPTGHNTGGYTRQWTHTYYGGQPTTTIYGGHPGTWQPANPPAPRGEWCGTGLPQRRPPKQKTFKIIFGSDGIQFVDSTRPGRGPRGNAPGGSGPRGNRPPRQRDARRRNAGRRSHEWNAWADSRITPGSATRMTRKCLSFLTSRQAW